MQLTQLQQSGFILELADGTRAAWDIGSFTSLEELAYVPEVDIFIVSHIHSDHFSPDHINKLHPKKLFCNGQCAQAFTAEFSDTEVKIVQPGDKEIAGSLEIEFFAVDHGPNAGQPLEDNLGFLIKITAEHKSIYFAGDMYAESGMPVKGLEVDYALLPIGGHYTFGPEEALAFSNEFARIGELIPMHHSIRPESLDEFRKLL